MPFGNAPLPFTTELLAAFPAEEILPALFDVSLTGLAFYQPIFGADNQTIVDFDFIYFNAAAQKILGVSSRPEGTYLMHYPHTKATGVFDFHIAAFHSGKHETFRVNYQADGLDNYFYLAAQRVGKWLLVSFTDTAEHPRTAVEAALRISQAREKAALAEVEAQRQQLYTLFMQAPAMICILEGPTHIFRLVNPLYQQLVGDRPILGKPIAEAMPELANQRIFSLLDKVYQTGKSFYATEMQVRLDHSNTGTQKLGERYYNFIYQASRDAAGEIQGILVFAYEVTKQVEARHQVEESELKLLTLNIQLAEANEELQAANAAMLANNDVLQRTQEALQRLNDELETRVTLRTHELQASQAETARQRDRLVRFFMQAPAAICILDGPDLVFELVNPNYQQLFPGRQLLGRRLLDALPEVADNDMYRMSREVFETGRTQEAQGMHIALRRPDDGEFEDRYFTFIEQARHDEQGRIDGILVFAYEVTEQVLARQKVAEANAELSAANDRLVRINQDLDNFVYTASHDLRQPVNNMAGIFEELRRSATFHDPEAEQLMSMFENALGQIHTTVHDLAEAVQTERQAGQHPIEPVDLQSVTQSVINSMHNQATALNARFELDFTAVPTIRFARLNLQSVLYNLLSNALKYSHPDRPPRVCIATERSAAGAPVLTVQDNGLGLDLGRYGSDLFQMFRRFHDHVPGSGMGLYLVNRIVQQSGGRIEVSSVLGQGTTFRIVMPAEVLPPA